MINSSVENVFSVIKRDTEFTKLRIYAILEWYTRPTAGSAGG